MTLTSNCNQQTPRSFFISHRSEHVSKMIRTGSTVTGWW
ncbi:hypothetical protein HSB1_26550 [Halogranum salarium B-1]|uniref:Uncharacterized protein n=1 Tax=Halogranum salarium B-1 TaxID=1210908 RepID=J3JFG4_9EURY|nr:hypothetical protein HSB1_26550 [Halogranum salarium B-1]